MMRLWRSSSSGAFVKLITQKKLHFDFFAFVTLKPVSRGNPQPQVQGLLVSGKCLNFVARLKNILKYKKSLTEESIKRLYDF